MESSESSVTTAGNTLIDKLKETILYYKDKDTLEVMANEHSIFIPVALIVKGESEIDSFIRLARKIKNTPEWFCPISVVEEVNRAVNGLEFILTFSKKTQFDKIIQEVDNTIKELGEKQ